ncbi:hypothetical protein BC938DRAFT_483891 [Jimgerdemannia flammicorona]|nr:hypothetical protein BC938DRAFT_483891 [Jimgerdemannia flammicorona]
MAVDDPLLIIQWNERGFNNVPGAPGLRDGVAGQTRDSLINIIIANGGVDELGMHTIFRFRHGQDIVNCDGAMPNW